MFLVTRRMTASIILVRWEPPAGESKNCLTTTAANPELPPMYSMIRSSISLEWGMLSPPVVAAPRKASMAFRSIRVMRRAVRPFFWAACFFRRHPWQRGSHSASFPGRKYSSVLG